MTRFHNARYVAAFALLAGVCVALVGFPTHASAGRKAYFTQGHVDFVDVGLEDGQLGLTFHDHGGTGIEFAPSDAVMFVKSAAKQTIPSPCGNFCFLGSGGATVWVLPQVQDPNLLFAGFSTEEIDTGTVQGGVIHVRLVKVEGPGNFIAYQNATLGAPIVLLNSNGGPSILNLAEEQHMHSNLAFTQKGTYHLTFEATATLMNGTALDSGPATYTVIVDDSQGLRDLHLPCGAAVCYVP